MDLLKGTGVLIYDPYRGKMKRNTNWWIVVNTDNEIARYYRWWVMKRYWIDLKAPSWGAHISVLRGGKPRNDKQHLWKKYQGEKIDFVYSPNVRQSNNTTGSNDHPNHFWFVDVWSNRLNEIRNELGFTTVFDDKPIRYHMTVGRTY